MQARPIKRTSLKDHVVTYIRDAILTGKLESGERIVELKLARELQIGTTAVREALFELESLGFVTRIVSKGTFVTKLSAEDVEQTFRVRRELESLAAQLVHERLVQSKLDIGELLSLEKYVEQMRSAAASQSLADFYQCDLEFHRTLWNMANNRYLARVLDQLVVPLFTFFIMRKNQNNTTELLQSVDMHLELIEMLRRGENPREQFADAITFFGQLERQLLLAQPHSKGLASKSDG